MKKENMDLSMRNHVEDETPVSCSLKYSTEVAQVDFSSLGFPELRWNVGKINTNLSLIVDIKQPEVNTGFSQMPESHPCSSRLNFQDHINVINTDRSIAPICVDIAEVNSDSLHILFKTGDLSSPLKTTSSRYTFKSLRQGRRTRSVSNLSDSIVERSLAVLSGNVGTSPSAKWMHEPTDVSSKGRTFMRGELFSKALRADTIKEQDKSISAIGRDGESLELMAFPSRNFCLLSENPKLSVTPFIRRRSDAAISKQLLLSYTSTKPAIIRCVWKSNVPCFLFSSDDGQGNIYMARPLKARPSTSEDLDYIYLFHSCDSNRNTSKSQVPSTSDNIGKMKVSSSLYVDSNRVKSMETKFVLFASDDEHVSEKQKSSILTKMGGISGKVAEIFRTTHSLNYNSMQKIYASDSLFDDKLHIFAPDISITKERGRLVSIVDELSPNLELAAIVVKDKYYDNLKVAPFTGWGLNFLEKSQTNNDDSQTRLFPSAKSKGASIPHVNVLVPTGLHGGPAGRNGCPSSLLERWRSNGHCDCGGWDIGCPLKILSNASNSSKISPKQELEEDFKSLQLFPQGAKQRDPQFKLLSLTSDMYAMHFQSTLSALQSFAIAIAIIHSRTPDLYSKLPRFCTASKNSTWTKHSDDHGLIISALVQRPRGCSSFSEITLNMHLSNPLNSLHDSASNADKQSFRSASSADKQSFANNTSLATTAI